MEFSTEDQVGREVACVFFCHDDKSRRMTHKRGRSIEMDRIPIGQKIWRLHFHAAFEKYSRDSSLTMRNYATVWQRWDRTWHNMKIIFILPFNGRISFSHQQLFIIKCKWNEFRFLIQFRLQWFESIYQRESSFY